MVDLTLHNVNKQIKGKQILQVIDLIIPQGQTLALLGPNGSGKTTLMKLIIGLQYPTSGKISIAGNRPGTRRALQSIAYLPEESCLHQWMQVGEMVDYYQSFYHDLDQEKLESLLTFMQLERNQKIAELAHGMKRRLELALVMARQASIFLLDEPFQGIDLLSRTKILQAIIREHAFGKATLIISTHLIEDVEHLVERLVLLKDGQIAIDTDLEEWKIAQSKALEELYCEVYTG